MRRVALWAAIGFTTCAAIGALVGSKIADELDRLKGLAR